MQQEPQASTSQVDRPQRLMELAATPAFLFRAGLVVVLALYLRTLAFDFVYDDLALPVSPWLASWHGVVEAFRSDVFGDKGVAGSAYYRPLASTLMIAVARVASPTPAWFHLMAIVLLVVMYALCYRLGQILFKDDWIAALAAVLFALHPTKVESVAWLSSAGCDGQVAI